MTDRFDPAASDSRWQERWEKAGSFRAAFEDKAPHSELMRTLPVYVITDPVGALAGLSAYACFPERFGVETQGRRWRR